MDRPIVRPPGSLDARPMARLLNALIAEGGTTALTEPVTPEDLRAWAGAEGAFWALAEIDGDVMGFQWIEPWDALPPEAANIATFVAPGRGGMGIGSALFEVTADAARDLGYAWINANIRADNDSGLAYYQSRGFRDWKTVRNVRLADGRVVDKIWKRYDLD